MEGREGNERPNKTGKEQIKPPLFADDMMGYAEHSKECNQKVLKLKTEFISKAAGYKVGQYKEISHISVNKQ